MYYGLFGTMGLLACYVAVVYGFDAVVRGVLLQTLARTAVHSPAGGFASNVVDSFF
jgi:hypothetical protein